MLPVVRRSVDFSFESNSMLMLGWGGVEWGGERGGWREDRERNQVDGLLSGEEWEEWMGERGAKKLNLGLSMLNPCRCL